MSTNHWPQNPWRAPLVLIAFAVIPNLLNCKAPQSRNQQLPNSSIPSPEPTMLVGRSNEVSSVAFSPDGKTVASGNVGGKIIFWDVETAEVKRTLTDRGIPMASVTFSPDGKMLASEDLVGGIRLWDVQTWEVKQKLLGKRGVFSPDSKIVASSVENFVALWDVNTGEKKLVLRGHNNPVVINSIAISPNGKMVASGSGTFAGNGYETAILWDSQTGEVKHVIKFAEYGNIRVAFSPDSKTVAIMYGDGPVVMVNAQKGDSAPMRAMGRGGVAFSPDGKTLASVSEYKTVKLWDAKTWEVKQTLTGHESTVNSVAFSPNSKMLASGSSDKTVRLWDAQTGQLRLILTGARP